MRDRFAFAVRSRRPYVGLHFDAFDVEAGGANVADGRLWSLFAAGDNSPVVYDGGMGAS